LHGKRIIIIKSYIILSCVSFSKNNWNPASIFIVHDQAVCVDISFTPVRKRHIFTREIMFQPTHTLRKGVLKWLLFCPQQVPSSPVAWAHIFVFTSQYQIHTGSSLGKRKSLLMLVLHMQVLCARPWRST